MPEVSDCMRVLDYSPTAQGSTGPRGGAGREGRGLSSSLLPLKVTGQRMDVHQA